MRKLIFAAAVAAMSLSIAGCDDTPAPTTKERQSARAAEAANSINFDQNGEIDNIKKRLTLTSNPGAIGFIVLLNEAGQPILYTGVKGKITSSGKRLTRPWQNCPYVDCGAVEGPSDEGTWGSSDPYIYFWDTNDTYHQWSGRYLYSDKPIRMRIEPLVINTQGAN